MKKYTIQRGDTLTKIANKFYKDPQRFRDIAKANGIANPAMIAVGQELVLPGIKEDVPVAGTEAAWEATSTLLTTAGLQEIMPAASPENIVTYIKPLNVQMSKFHINTPLRAAHFIAQLAHESGSFAHVSENLNYSAQALRRVFGKYFPTDTLAEEYARKPEMIANRVYANRMGNGNEGSGDGWRYRGRGLIQLTGKDNYRLCAAATGLDLIKEPEQLEKNPNAAVAAAGWFWNMRQLNTYADRDDIRAITKRINGGYNGLEDRMHFLAKARDVLRV